MSETIDLQFRAIVVKAERTGSAGAIRAITPDANGNIVLDLSTVIPADRVRDVSVDDYAEITISLRKREDVEKPEELAA